MLSIIPGILCYMQLSIVAEWVNYDCIKMLIDHGADVNAVNNSGNTVLHAAFKTFGELNYDCIKILIDHGADVNAVDNSGNTVLHAAFKSSKGKLRLYKDAN
jgi:ankyrin repeat protein